MSVFKLIFFCSMCRFGYIDRINGQMAVIEYRDGQSTLYIDLPVNTSPCLLKEGQIVMFNSKSIVDCLEIKK